MFNLGIDWEIVDSKYLHSKYLNTKGLEFSIIEVYRNKLNLNKKYKIRFTETGYTTISYKSDINKGLIKDKLTPSFWGVGCMGYATVKNGLNKKEFSMWTAMLSRCYNELNVENYSRYGALGVSVCDRWKRFDFYLEDLKQVEGYDEKLFLKGKIVLDKDKKQLHLPKNKRVYSKETCCFISKIENDKYRVLNKIPIKAVKNNKEFEFESLRDFCEYANINQSRSSTMLNKKETYDGWSIFKIK